jgi:hypothetical protein
MARQSFKPSSRDRRHMVDVADDGQTPNGVSVDLDDKDPDKYEIIETDDTPEYDRGKPTDLDYSLADQEDDLRDVGEKTRKRIDRLKFETHTERRGREAAERERDAALEMIKQQNGDLQKLRQRDGAAAVALAESMTSSNKSSMESAQRKLAAAHDEGNGTDIAAATAEISALAAQAQSIRERTPRPRPQGEAATAPMPAAPASNLAPRVQDWIKSNTWFQQPGNENKTAKAMSIHYELVADGVSPHEERYTQELDKRLKKAYPDGNTGGSQSAPRRSDAVESGSREDSATSSPRKVRLTNSQVAIAKRLGVSLQEYAKQVALRNARNGDGA